MSASQNVAIYGAGGDAIGKHILDALFENKYNVTVIARQSSKGKYLASANLVRVADNLPHDELVRAFRNNHIDTVISAVGNQGHGVESQRSLIDAAVEAGVGRFFPSEYGFDNGDVKTAELSPIFAPKHEIQKYLEAKVREHSNFSWTAVASGIWLEWALPRGFLSIDPTAHTVSYWDNGVHAPTHTTQAYAAQAVIECLRHPEIGRNQRVFLEAFAASQRDIVAELERQQGVTYTVKEPINGAQTVKDAQEKWAKSGETDWMSAYTTVAAEVLMKEYGADNVKSGKSPMLENLVKLPKLTLQGVVKEVVESSI